MVALAPREELRLRMHFHCILLICLLHFYPAPWHPQGTSRRLTNLMKYNTFSRSFHRLIAMESDLFEMCHLL